MYLPRFSSVYRARTTGINVIMGLQKERKLCIQLVLQSQHSHTGSLHSSLVKQTIFRFAHVCEKERRDKRFGDGLEIQWNVDEIHTRATSYWKRWGLFVHTSYSMVCHALRFDIQLSGTMFAQYRQSSHSHLNSSVTYKMRRIKRDI